MLEVASTNSISTFNSAKVQGLAVWTLQSQRLPLDVISSEYSRISCVFEGIVKVNVDRPIDSRLIHDGLKVEAVVYVINLSS